MQDDWCNKKNCQNKGDQTSYVGVYTLMNNQSLTCPQIPLMTRTPLAHHHSIIENESHT